MLFSPEETSRGFPPLTSSRIPHPSSLIPVLTASGPDRMLPVTWLLEAHDEAADRPAAGHRRRPHPSHARLGADARLRRVALHPTAHRRRADDRECRALSGAAPPR